MNELLKSLLCSGTECFCWIIVLFNIFAVFYLVFCSFWNVTKLVKIFGWIHAGALICAAILSQISAISSSDTSMLSISSLIFLVLSVKIKLN